MQEVNTHRIGDVESVNVENWEDRSSTVRFRIKVYFKLIV